MSGGSYDYAYHRIYDMADKVEAALVPCPCDRVKHWCECPSANVTDKETRRLRTEFAAMLRKVAKAAHDIEWVDSGDYGPGDEIEALRRVLGEG